MSDKKKCGGYVYHGDQGIEWCEECGGCLCCDHEDVDHSDARYRCLEVGDECVLLGNRHHPNHDCRRDAWPTKSTPA